MNEDDRTETERIVDRAKEDPSIEPTGDFMFYCPSHEVLLDPGAAYEHTYAHQDKGPNTGAVLETFKKIPVAEPRTGEYRDDE